MDKILNHRFKRQIALREIGKEGQEKLLKSRVLVIGGGGLGHPVISYLVSMGIGHLGVCEYDTVDETNIHRQFLFGVSEVGRKKGEVIAEWIKKSGHELSLELFGSKLTRENVCERFSNYDVVVDCTDNFTAKFLIHDVAFLLRKVLVQASIYQYEGSLNVFDFRERQVPCLRCLWPNGVEEGCVGNCAEAGVLGAVPGVFGSLQAMEVVKSILNLSPLKNGESICMDLLDLHMQKLSWKRADNCPLCSKRNSLQSIEELPLPSVKAYERRWDELKNQNDALWIDIRSEEERKKLPGPWIKFPKLLNISAEEVLSRAFDENQIIICCQRGVRSAKLVKELFARGENRFLSLYGGVEACLG